jgi:hypothetical protein
MRQVSGTLHLIQEDQQARGRGSALMRLYWGLRIKAQHLCPPLSRPPAIQTRPVDGGELERGTLVSLVDDRGALEPRDRHNRFSHSHTEPRE